MVRSSRELIVIRVILVAAFLIICAGLLVGRLYYVQICLHEEYFAKAQGRYTAARTIRGKRGEIFDRNGHLLVGNRPCETLVVDPSLIPADYPVELLINEICARIPVSPEHVRRQITTKTRDVTREDGSIRTVELKYAIIGRYIDPATVKELRKAVSELKPGIQRAAIYGEEDFIRFYPKNSLLSNVLGLTSYSQGEYVAVMGVEQSYNELMTPSRGKMVYERSRDGMQLPYGLLKVMDEERDGLDVYLTIDEVIQSFVEEEMAKMVQEFRPLSATVIMADPKTGDILAMAQYPSFDPNDRANLDSNALSDQRRILAIDKAYEPGSIMKALSISLAIDDGIVTPNTMIDAEGGTWYYMRRVLTDSSRRGVISVAEAVQKSSNIVTAKIGLMLGADRLYHGLRAFGLGQKTGIPLQPESTGLFMLNKVDGLWVTRVPIGYSVAVSPLPAQAARAFSRCRSIASLKAATSTPTPRDFNASWVRSSGKP